MVTTKRPISLIVSIVIFAVIVVGIIYFVSLQSSTSNKTTLPKPQSGQVVVNLTPLNNSGESGTAVLEEKDGYVIVTLNVLGGKKGVAQPAHIHTDICPGLGPVKYSLKNVVNGTSVTTLNVKLAQLKQEFPLAINVHESTDNFKNYVTCGEVSF